MKTFIKTFGTLALLAAIALSAPAVWASSGWNDGAQGADCPTVMVAKQSDAPGAYDCWATSESATNGDIVTFAIYYHNTGNSPVSNVSVFIQPPGSGAQNSFTLSGGVLVNGQQVASGSATINLDASSTLVFNEATNEYNGDVNYENINGSLLTSSSGYNLGTVGTGWSNQGVAKISYKVVSNGNNNTCQAPTVSTSNYSNFDAANGNVQLNGYFDSNNSDTTTYFQYRTNGGSWTDTPSVDRGISSGASFSYNLNNLPAGSYEYQAVAVNNACGGTPVYGTSYFFTVGGGGNTCPSGYTWNGTACVQNIQTCPAGYYLSGNVCVQNVQTCGYNQYWNGSYCQNNIQTCPAGYYLSGNTCIQSQQTCGYNQYWNGSYCQTNVQTCPSGYYLSGNTCIQSQQTCGYNQYWNGSYCVSNVNQVTTGAPSVTTLGTISVGATAAAIDGYYTANGCDAYTSFNYGTTQALGNTTGAVDRGTGSGSMAQSISGLAPNTTYYYQAAARDCVSTAVGSILSFTTGSNTTNDTVITHYVDVNTGGGGGNTFINLTIDNHQTVVGSGLAIPYDVSWQNLTNETLNNLVLEVNFPSQMTIINPGSGQIEAGKTSVVYHIDSLGPKETGNMTITVQVTGNLKQGDPVVAQAIMAFQNPKTSAALNAIAYDADQFSNANSVLGASIFGLGFLPGSLIGWLILLLILLIIIILAHSYITRQRSQTTTVVNNHLPGGPVQNLPLEQMPPAGASGNDYVVYRPNPKQ